MNEIWLDKIEQYLNGNMSPKARLHFESEIAANEELYALFEEYKAIETEMRNTLKYSDDEAALENTLKKLNAVYFTGTADETNKTPEIPGVVNLGKSIQKAGAASMPLQARSGGKIKKLNSWRTLSAAAVVLGIILSGVLWFFYNQPDNPQIVIKNRDGSTSNNKITDTIKAITNVDTLLNKLNEPDAGVTQENNQTPSGNINKFKMNDARRGQLFAANFKPDTLPSDIPSSLEEPMADYKAAKHRDALKGFDAVDPNNVTRGTEEDDQLVAFYIYYYTAQSYLATNNTLKAITALRNAVTVSPDSSSRNKVNWYLALAYLKNGSINKAQLLLQELVSNSQAAAYRQQAGVLLKDLGE